MIGTIRKHSTWLWIIIIAATIITFVFWGSQTSRFDGAGGGRANYGSINGERISREDFFNAQREVYLRYFLSYGSWPDQDAKRMGFDVDRETYFRLLLLQKQRQLGIHIGGKAVAKVAAEVLRSLNRGNPLPLDVFVKQVLNRQGLTATDFERFIRHDLAIQQLMAASGLSGQLVTLEEGRLIYEREHQELAAEAVFFSGSNYLSGVTATPEAVAQFYSNQMARYRLPDRVQVKYVEFPATNFLAEAQKQMAAITNLEEIIEARYRDLGTNYFRDAKSPAEAKERIHDLMLTNQALAAAQKQASEFARTVFETEPMRPENLDRFAKEKGLTALVTQPFDREYGPKELEVRPEFTKRAFALSADEPFAGPLAGRDAVYVMAMDQKLPSEIPPLERIREQVAADYKFDLALKAATHAGETFASTLTNGLAIGKTFSALCAEARVRPVSPPPFSLSTRELPLIEAHVNLNQFKQAVFTTEVGKSSSFVPTSDGGFVVFVRERMPLELAKITANLPAFMNSLRQARQNEAFNEWFRKEADRGLRDTPLFRAPPPQLQPSSGAKQ